MARRPIIGKKLNRLRKQLRVSPPAFLDLVQWLKDHRYAQTTGQANRLILAGKVRHGSHVIGIRKVDSQEPTGEVVQVDTVYPYVPSEWRGELIVLGS